MTAAVLERTNDDGSGTVLMLQLSDSNSVDVVPLFENTTEVNVVPLTPLKFM